MNAIALLEQQHREVEELAEQFLALGSEAVDEKRSIARTAIEQLSIHATLEEMAFYPAVKDAAPAMADRIDQDLQEHQRIKDLAQELLGMDPEDARFATTIIQLVGEVRQHVEEEEADVFPQVREVMTDEELDELGDTLLDLQDDAARRPHPWAPDEPPLNTLAVPVASRLDRLRSRVRDRIGKKSI